MTDPIHIAIVLVGTFLAGFPAMQAHSIISGEAMWERYAVSATWVHWPLLALFLRQYVSQQFTVRTIAGSLMVCWIALVPIGRLRQNWTFDHQPAIDCLSELAQADDAFLAQDIDMWQGESNFYRLWHDRYSTIDLNIVSGPPKGRFELEDNGIPIEDLDVSVNRVWIYSHMFLPTEAKLEQSNQWRLIAKLTLGAGPPLALLERINSDHCQ